MEPDPIVHNPPSRRLNNRRHHLWNFTTTHFQVHNDGRAADDTTFGDRACTTGVSNWSNICTCGTSTGTPSDCGTSVVCTVTTRHQSLNKTDVNNLSNNCICEKSTMPPKDSREVQHIDVELIDDRERKGQGRRSIFPHRLSTARLRLPRQLATAKWRHDAGFSGPFPSHNGVFGPPQLFVCCSPRWVESTSLFGS